MRRTIFRRYAPLEECFPCIAQNTLTLLFLRYYGDVREREGDVIVGVGGGGGGEGFRFLVPTGGWRRDDEDDRDGPTAADPLTAV